MSRVRLSERVGGAAYGSDVPKSARAFRTTARSPSARSSVTPSSVAEDGSAQIPEPVQEELSLVRFAEREADLLVVAPLAPYAAGVPDELGLGERPQVGHRADASRHGSPLA